MAVAKDDNAAAPIHTGTIYDLNEGQGQEAVDLGHGQDL